MSTEKKTGCGYAEGYDPGSTDPVPDWAKREPLLSDEDIDSLKGGRFELGLGMKHARQVYEAKITSGELRVVKEVAYSTLFPDQPGHSCCDECSWTTEDTYWTQALFCPGCGNPIKRSE